MVPSLVDGGIVLGRIPSVKLICVPSFITLCFLLYMYCLICFLCNFYCQVGDDVYVIDATGKFVMPG
jgi:hypothetical protein